MEVSTLRCASDFHRLPGAESREQFEKGGTLSGEQAIGSEAP
jgi:hypothetical protein